MKQVTLFWVLVLPILFARVNIYSPEENLEIASAKRISLQNPRIAFLTFNISKKPNEKIVIELLDKVVVKGTLKKENLDIKGAKQGDLICMVLDRDSTVQKTKIISNPLKRSVEHVNTSGEFQRKEVISDNEQFSIRLQLLKNSKYVIIKQVDVLTNQSPVLFSIEID